jgi:hypothetical protein
MKLSFKRGRGEQGSQLNEEERKAGQIEIHCRVAKQGARPFIHTKNWVLGISG